MVRVQDFAETTLVDIRRELGMMDGTSRRPIDAEGRKENLQVRFKGQNSRQDVWKKNKVCRWEDLCQVGTPRFFREVPGRQKHLPGISGEFPYN